MNTVHRVFTGRAEFVAEGALLQLCCAMLTTVVVTPEVLGHTDTQLQKANLSQSQSHILLAFDLTAQGDTLEQFITDSRTSYIKLLLIQGHEHDMANLGGQKTTRVARYTYISMLAYEGLFEVFGWSTARRGWWHLVGRGAVAMVSTTRVMMTGLPSKLHLLTTLFCTRAIFSGATSRPKLPRLMMTPSAAVAMLAKLYKAARFSTCTNQALILPQQLLLYT